jgi:hypothetical protein
MSITSASDRKKAAHLVAQWLDGRITNYEIDDQWPWESEDFAVVDIGSELWTLFDDFPETRLNVSAMRPEDVGLLRRCLRFLESGEHYEPVPREQRQETKGIVAKLLGFGQKCPEAMPLKIPESRRNWWPFGDESQWQKFSGE